jgi:hypothetical protein
MELIDAGEAARQTVEARKELGPVVEERKEARVQKIMERLEQGVREAVETGVPFVVEYDSSKEEQLDLLESHITREIQDAIKAGKGVTTVRDSLLDVISVSNLKRVLDLMKEQGFTCKKTKIGTELTLEISWLAPSQQV